MGDQLEVKPHAVCIPYPAQGHISPMKQLANVLHSKGFHVTYVNTEYNHKRLLKSRGPDLSYSIPDFRFESIPDGMPETNLDATQDIPAFPFLALHFTEENCLSNGYLNTPLDWIPGMPGARIKDMPSFIRTIDPNDIMLNFLKDGALESLKGSAHIIIHLMHSSRPPSTSFAPFPHPSTPLVPYPPFVAHWSTPNSCTSALAFGKKTQDA
ncbi:hypothetical protein AMTR_s00033p00058130 [Amborella trichopoda]|uniref:Uncharacterized protein n=1 Tax=Amborella trichopoda TaxID=13333 RepID=U5CM38_AMBTC|nr:hypothetical protein AMTR_s00033p00058130 [Amborella trichopoda]